MSDPLFPLPSVLRSRSFWRGPFPLILIFFAAFNVWVWKDRSKRTEEQQANLTSGDLGSSDPSERVYDDTFGMDIGSCLSRIPDSRKTPLCIVTGMSQMHTINDRQPGDKLIVEEMDGKLARKGVRCFGLAAPNLCNEEALLILLISLSSEQTHPQVFLYGNCFDKYRNVDLRPSFQAFLRGRPELQAAWHAAAIRGKDKYPAASEKMLGTLDSLISASASAVDDPLEQWLRKTSGAVVPIIADRKQLNAVSQQFLFQLRNWTLGIKNSSKRPVIRSRYELNQQFLELIMDECRAHGVEFVTYVIPLNPVAENPYVDSEYIAYKEWLAALCSTRKVAFANFENLVPTEEWGEWMGGPDFKHFKGPAHKRTAAAIVDRFGPGLLGGDAGGPQP